MEVDDDARGGVVAVEGTEAPPADRSAPPSATVAAGGAGGSAARHADPSTPRTGRASRRRKKQPTQLAVDVPYKILISPALCSVLVGGLVRFLLAVREQIPCAYTDLERWHHATVEFENRLQAEAGEGRLPRRKKKLTAGNRKKARKLASAADELLHDHLFALFTEPVDRVFVLLGSSVISAKEVYAMEFVHGIDWEDEAEPVQRVSPCAAYPYGPAYTVYRSPNVVQRANAVERKLLQTFVAGCQPVMGITLQPTRMFVLAYSRAGRVIPGFVPKRIYRPQLPRSASGVAVQLGVQAGLQVDDFEPRHTEVGDDGVWYQWKGVLRGFKGPLDLSHPE